MVKTAIDAKTGSCERANVYRPYNACNMTPRIIGSDYGESLSLV